MGKQVPTTTGLAVIAVSILVIYLLANKADSSRPPLAVTEAPGAGATPPPQPPSVESLTADLAKAEELGDFVEAFRVANQIQAMHPESDAALDVSQRLPDLERRRDLLLAEAERQRERSRLEGLWHYSIRTDPMTDSKTHHANIESKNAVTFGFPYGGPHRLRLTLRTHPQFGKDVILNIPKGQMICRYDGCSVQVRFDDGAVQQFSAAEASDHSSDTLFIRNYSRFVGGMMKAQRVRVAIQFYREGTFTFDFETGGFQADRYLGK